MILIILLVLVLAVVFILQFVGNSKQSTYAQFKDCLLYTSPSPRDRG